MDLIAFFGGAHLLRERYRVSRMREIRPPASMVEN